MLPAGRLVMSLCFLLQALAKDALEARALENRRLRRADLDSTMLAKDAEVTREWLKDPFNEVPPKRCRYCHQTNGSMLSPCLCKGSNFWSHRDCLKEVQRTVWPRCPDCQTHWWWNGDSQYTGPRQGGLDEIGRR
eukprot:gnl/TRDRNA2_/TRDRNA2_169420_c1_seq1.p1 gnl/TRDRNA2_/TRDRNA2_169420_c1~~gnl/TRDRNA2_/TRDRNA2_169420_c1_seq1.p1  ORF type:complete len:135 (-),score=9.18 gnl/TRDRNA2_/TRDRNA2_169420_c1_seq1:85-489(-)